MKVSRILTTATLGMLLSMPNLFAEQKEELRILTALTVEGQLVPAGEYTLEWDNSMLREGQVMKIIRRNKVVATLRGEWVTLERRSPDDALVVSNEGGVRILVQIRFKGKDRALEVSREILANTNKIDGTGHVKSDAPK
jgi:hypothetical protein